MYLLAENFFLVLTGGSLGTLFGYVKINNDLQKGKIFPGPTALVGEFVFYIFVGSMSFPIIYKKILSNN